MTRNKKYNYFYKSIDYDNGKGFFDNNFKLPYIEKIGKPNTKKNNNINNWAVNKNKNDVNNYNINANNDEPNTDHSVL